MMHAAFLLREQNEAEADKQLTQLIKEPWAGDYGRLEDKTVLWRFIVNIEDPCLIRKESVEAIKPCSKEVPILFFITTSEICCETEDGEMGDFSGWGFRIFYQGEEKANVMFHYHWPSYGEELKKELDNTLKTFDPSLFKLFHLGEKREAMLTQLLNPSTLFERLEDMDTLEEIEREFAQVLGIEMDFFYLE